MSCPEGYPRHFLNVLPPMAPEDRKELKASIKHDGLDHEIELFEDCILDGWNRQDVCLELTAEGVPDRKPRYKQWRPRQDDTRPVYVQAAVHILIENFKRRQWASASQRAMIALELMNVAQKAGRPATLPQKNPEKPGSKIVGHPTVSAQITQGAAAKSANVSREVMNLANKVKEQGIPDLKRRIKEGELTVYEAQNILDLPPAKQKKALELLDNKECTSLAAAYRFLAARNREHPGASVKTKEYWVQALIPILAESDALAVDMIEKRNADRRMPAPVMQAVGLKVGGVKSFVRCVQCRCLIYESTPQVKTAEGVKCKQCPEGKDRRSE